MMERPVTRIVEVIRGQRRIAAFLGIRRGRVAQLAAAGAPIFRDAETGVLRAEKSELWSWWIHEA